VASWFSRILTVGCVGADVELVQRKLRASNITGLFDAETASRVRGLQWADKLPVTGMVDYTTSDAIGESIRLGMIPDWFSRDMVTGCTGADVTRLRSLLGLPDGDGFDAPVEAAVRRFQSTHHLPLTGVMGEADATALGDDAPWHAV
jgi:peptidoglycan hydrolase-like protein with peptidoglycan-binding domain